MVCSPINLMSLMNTECVPGTELCYEEEKQEIEPALKTSGIPPPQPPWGRLTNKELIIQQCY